MFRAINIASTHIKEFEINTGDFKNDIKTKELLEKFLGLTVKYCDFPIKEQEFFQDVSKVIDIL